MLNRIKYQFFILVFAIGLMENPAHAKGLDELSPKVEEPGEPPASEAMNAENAKKPEEQMAPPPSETSKALSNKLFVGTGFGFSTMDSSEGGEWVAGGATDVQVGYFWGGAIMGFQMAATYRYQAVDVTVEEKGLSFRGVVESHFFGTNYVMPKSGYDIVAISELGFATIHMNSLDNFGSDFDQETAVIANLSGGADWQVLEKIKVGARLNVGAGSVSFVQLASSVSFMF